MTEPIFLQGICKDYLWGGNRLREEYGKKSDADKIAESWELACHKDGSSILTTGADAGKDLREYLDEHGTGFLGTNCAGCTTVPVLIKLIDAKQDLSIQVHPDDDYAMRVEGEPGKTEMWYIMDAAPGAALYYGLNRAVSKEEFAKRIQEQTLTEILNRVEVSRVSCTLSRPARSTPSAQASCWRRSSRTPTPPIGSMTTADVAQTASCVRCTSKRRWM